MNPEFKRNLWLEISTSRLLIMPMVLALVVVLSVVLGRDKPLEALLVAAIVMCALLLVGWGSFAVMGSINSEVAERTWDQQRLSALTPWEMAWGKLFGSTAYAWYGGLLCAVIIFIVLQLQPDAFKHTLMLFTSLIGAVALHAGLMASRLHTLDIRSEKTSGTVGRLFGLLILLQVLPALFLLPANLAGEGGDISVQGGWWGLNLPIQIQNLVVTCVLLALGLLALWRSMSKQLMLRTTPWAWVLGIVVLSLVLAGFALTSKMRAVPLLIIAATAIAATYFAIITENNNLLVWRSVVFHWKNSSTKRFLQALPLWPVSLVLAFVVSVLYTVFQSGQSMELYKSNAVGVTLASSVVSILWMSALHCLRDCGIYLFFAFRNTTKKPLGMTLLTLFILSVILPTMFAFGSSGVSQLFEPMYGLQNPIKNESILSLTSWIAMFAHLLIVYGLVLWRWFKAAKTV